MTSPVTVILVAGLMLLVFGFLPGAPYRLEQYDLPKELTVGAVGGLSALYLMAREDAGDLDNQAIALWGFGIFGAVLVALVAKNASAGWRTMGMLGAVGAIFLLARSTSARIGPERIYCLTILLIFASCVIVLLEAYAAIPFLSSPGRRPGGTLGNRNLAARIACLALPLIWNRLIGTKHHAMQVGLFVVGSCVIATIVISRSRASYLTALILVIGLPMFTAMTRRVTWKPLAKSTYLIWLAGSSADLCVDRC